MTTRATAVAARIADFLAGSSYAVVGASADRAKFGNKVLRAYQSRSGNTVYAVNARAAAADAAARIEGARVVARVGDLPEVPHVVSVVTPPAVTDTVARDCVAAGVKRVWMQPGADSASAVRYLEKNGVAVLYGGPCVLVELDRSDDD
mmetsp:Transcript_7228/g.17335  ORF Transcript_7228/g.17335 Transcript_7228/m.17335 type:complete len:148 (-) Transcript_7228:163-606(-)